MKRDPKYLIGEIFIELGHISKEQLDFALDKQRSKHQPLGEILLQAGMVTLEQLSEAIAKQTEAQLQNRYEQEMEYNRDFANDVLYTGQATESDVADCMKEVEEAFREEQKILQVSHVLMQNGILDVVKIKKLLSGDHKHVFSCESCDALYFISGRNKICRICKGHLEPVPHDPKGC